MKLTGKITKFFSWSEARCKNGVDVPPQYQRNAAMLSLTVLEVIRAEASAEVGHDCPVEVLSWYRTPAYNTACGGAPASQHLTASGADIRIPAYGDQFKVHELIERLVAAGKIPKNIGLGLYAPSYFAVPTASSQYLQAAQPTYGFRRGAGTIFFPGPGGVPALPAAGVSGMGYHRFRSRYAGNYGG